MKYLDINILKRNVRSLMAKHGTTQAQLAEYLGMSQPNVCKALNINEKKWFTMEQTYLISDYYGVSIDYLVGKWKAHSVSSTQEIVEMLIALIESETVSFSEISKTEWEYIPKTQASDPVKVSREMKYPALYFRDYWTPIPDVDDIDGEQSNILESKGNYTGNFPINKFLKEFIAIYNLHKNNGIEDETYRAVVQDLLNRID